VPDDSLPLDPSPLEIVFAALREHGGLPSAGRMLAQLAQTLEKEDDGVHNLADLILQDLSLTQRLLRVANTIPYRAGAGREPVTTITRAIVLLGFNQVRAAAMSLVLADGLLGADGAARLHADLHHALLSGSLARELLAQHGAVEAEEAGIVAMFRNVGRLLVAAFAPSTFAEVMEHAADAETSEAAAARHILGKSFDEVTELVLREWSMPARTLAAVAPLPPRFNAPKNSAERIRAAAQFGDEVAAALRLGRADGDGAIKKLLARYGAGLQVNREQLDTLIASAHEHTREIEAACGMRTAAPPDPEVEEQTIDERATDTDDVLPAEAQLAPAVAAPSAERDAVGRPANARDVLLAGLTEATAALARDADLNSVIRTVLETMYSGLGYARTALVLRDPATGLYRERAALGEPAPHFAFPLHRAPNLFDAALTRATDLHIANVRAEKISARLPDWFKRDFASTASFLLLPLTVKSKPVGFFYADRFVADDAGLSSEELNLLRTLRSQVLMAMRR